MATTPYTVEGFGGVDLLHDPTEIGATGAVDLKNVDFDRVGQVRTRDGNTLVKSLGAAFDYGGLASYQNGVGATPQLIVTYQTAGPVSKLEAYAATGGAAIATATPGQTKMSAANWGDTSNTRLYVADTGGVWRWNGATFTRPAMGSLTGAQFVTGSPRDNRLVAAWCNSDPAMVRFSDAGAPETFGANNFLELAPGDGTQITGVTTWQQYVVVTKPNRFFVFTGTSTDTAGNPIFNYYTVERFGSMIQPAVGDEGVFLFDGRYVYLWSTAAGPTRISRPIEPFLAGLTSLAGNTASPTIMDASTMAYSNGRLWLTVPSTPNPSAAGRTTVVYDPKANAWTCYALTGAGIAAGGVTTARNTIQPTTFWLSTDTTALGIYRVDPTVTTDNGTAISWSHTSGLYSPANDRSRVAISLESQLIGSGTATLQVATTGGSSSSSGAFDTGSAVTMGTAPAIAEGWQQIDREGALWQHKLSGTGAAAVAGLTHYLSFVKPEGVW